jgi:hypothetical protein
VKATANIDGPCPSGPLRSAGSKPPRVAVVRPPHCIAAFFSPSAAVQNTRSAAYSAEPAGAPGGCPGTYSETDVMWLPDVDLQSFVIGATLVLVFVLVGPR